MTWLISCLILMFFIYKKKTNSEFPIELRWLHRNKSCNHQPDQTFMDREKVAAFVPLLYLGCAALDGDHEHTAAPVPSSLGPWEPVPIVDRRPPCGLASRDFFHLLRNQKMKCKIISKLYGRKIYSQRNQCDKLKENIRINCNVYFSPKNNKKRYLVSPIYQNLDGNILSI